MSGSQPSTARLNFFWGAGKRGCQTLGVVFLNSERCLENLLLGSTVHKMEKFQVSRRMMMKVGDVVCMVGRSPDMHKVLVSLPGITQLWMR